MSMREIIFNFSEKYEYCNSYTNAALRCILGQTKELIKEKIGCSRNGRRFGRKRKERGKRTETGGLRKVCMAMCR